MFVIAVSTKGGLMKNFFLGVLVTVAVLGIGAFGYMRLGLAEVRGDVPPSRLENYLMASAVHAAVRRNAPDLPNPVPPTDENLIAGGKQYSGECEGCHGHPGKVRKFPTGLSPDPPQFAVVGTQYTEAQIMWVAKHGIRRTGMFSNGLWDSDQELWTMAAFIKRMNSLPQHVQDEVFKKPASGG
jgi:mono/diheme cytochrome c family protein